MRIEREGRGEAEEKEGRPLRHHELFHRHHHRVCPAVVHRQGRHQQLEGGSEGETRMERGGGGRVATGPDSWSRSLALLTWRRGEGGGRRRGEDERSGHHPILYAWTAGGGEASLYAIDRRCCCPASSSRHVQQRGCGRVDDVHGAGIMFFFFSFFLALHHDHRSS